MARQRKLAVPLGQAVRELRDGRSQEDIAHAAGISVRYLGEIERGRRSPSIDVVAAIAPAIGMSASELVREAEQRTR